MKIYIKEKNRFKQIFDSSKDSSRSLYYTTSSHLQQAGSLELFINKKIKKTVMFKALPPAKRDRPSIKLELNKLSELKVEIIKSYFQHSERSIIELTPEEAAGFNKILWGGVAFTALLIIAVPSFLYLAGLFPSFSENDKKRTELVEEISSEREEKQDSKKTGNNDQDAMEQNSNTSDTNFEVKEESAVESNLLKEKKEKEAADRQREQEKKDADLKSLISYAKKTVFYFEKDKASLLSGEEEKLNRLIKLLKESPSVSIIVEGHSAYIGLTANEERISKARAETVRDYLLKNSKVDLKITIAYYGSRKPVDHTSDSEAERQVNRRAKVIIVDQ